MLKINRDKKPDILKQKSIDCNKKKKIWNAIKKTLIIDVNGRCSYCAEQDISTTGGEIDHFLPKKIFLQKNVIGIIYFFIVENVTNIKVTNFLEKTKKMKLEN